jgi:hypothetical protein
VGLWLITILLLLQPLWRSKGRLLRESVPSPDVKGTLTPTITTALVNAVPTLWQVKKPTLTHKPFAIKYMCKAGFLFFGIATQNRIIASQTREEPHRMKLGVRSSCYAIFVVFLRFALRAEFRTRSIGASLVGVHGILCAVLAPMPVVRVASLNVLHHSCHPKTMIMSLLIFLSVACCQTWLRLSAIPFPIYIANNPRLKKKKLGT